MKNFIEIEHPTEKVGQEACTKLLAQVSSFVHESHLFDESNSCNGLRLIINPKLQTYSNVNQINSKLYWAFYADKMEIKSSTWRNFQLRCLHLEINEKAGVSSLLIVLMPALYSQSYTNREEQKDEDKDDVKSFIAVAPKYSLDKVIMTDETRRQIDRAIALINGRNKIFEEWGFKEIDPHTKTILCFYGAPGTGKTMCAHAISSQLGKKIIIASYASIESKWVGEGPKNLQKIFKDAEEQNAVLFFDEADSFLSKRVNNAETGSDKHYNRMSNEMFQLLEDYNGVIIFATNLVSDFDKAFKSRILAFVEFEKPDHNARVKLIKGMIPKSLPLRHPLSQDDYDVLAEISEGFSGREIRKSMLTSLSDAVLKGIEYFTINEFKEGFSAVKSETIAVEKSMDGQNTYIKDFMKETEINRHILDVCLKTVWQNTPINDLAKKELYSICKLLNLEMPDMSISYKDKELTEAVQRISEEQRVNECLKYSCELLAYSRMETEMKINYLDSLLTGFGIEAKHVFFDYLRIVQQINI